MRIEKVNRARYIICGMISSKGTGKGKLSSVGSKTEKIGMDKSMFEK